MKLLYGNDKIVADWVLARIKAEVPELCGLTDFGNCRATGVVSESGEPLAGCVYHDWQPGYKTMQLSFATVGNRPAVSRRILQGLLKYPFDIGVRKVWAATPRTHDRALRFLKGIGFTQEAVLAFHFGKTHAVICRMLERDFARHYGDTHGKEGRERAQAA